MAKGKKKANAKTNKIAKQNKAVAAAEIKEPVTVLADSAEATAEETVAVPVVAVNAEQADPAAVEVSDAPEKENADESAAPDKKTEAPAEKDAAKTPKEKKPAGKKTAPKAKTTEKAAAEKNPVAKKAVKQAAKKAEATKATEAKKPGRKPMTEQEKAEAKKERDAKKAAAANMKPKFVLQFQGQDADLEQLAEAAAADFKAKRKRTPLTELKIYLVPENGTAYYVANGDIEGSIPM